MTYKSSEFEKRFPTLATTKKLTKGKCEPGYSDKSLYIHDCDILHYLLKANKM